MVNSHYVILLGATRGVGGMHKGICGGDGSGMGHMNLGSEIFDGLKNDGE